MRILFLTILFAYLKSVPSYGSELSLAIKELSSTLRQLDFPDQAKPQMITVPVFQKYSLAWLQQNDAEALELVKQLEWLIYPDSDLDNISFVLTHARIRAASILIMKGDESLALTNRVFELVNRSKLIRLRYSKFTKEAGDFFAYIPLDKLGSESVETIFIRFLELVTHSQDVLVGADLMQKFGKNLEANPVTLTHLISVNTSGALRASNRKASEVENRINNRVYFNCLTDEDKSLLLEALAGFKSFASLFTEKKSCVEIMTRPSKTDNS